MKRWDDFREFRLQIVCDYNAAVNRCTRALKLSKLVFAYKYTKMLYERFKL